MSAVIIEHKPRPPADPDPAPEVRLISGDKIKPQSFKWLWPGWLALGKLHVLAGAPGTGKSTIVFTLAAAVTTGGRWPDGSKAPRGRVLIWSGEDDPADTIIPRLLAAGADRRRVLIVDGVTDRGKSRSFDPARDMDALRQALLSYTDVSLLIVDPLVSAVAGDSHKNAEVRRSLQPLVDLATTIRCAVLGVSHFSKGTQGRDPTERVTGSLAFGAQARIVMATAKSADGGRILVRAKSNIGPDSDGFAYSIELCAVPDHPGIEASRIRWGEALTGSARELLGAAEELPSDEDEPVTPRDQAADWLREVLSDGPIPAQDLKRLCTQNGIVWRTLHRAREQIGATCERVGYGRGSKVIWTLPESIRATSAELGTLASMASRGTYEGLTPGPAIHATDPTTGGTYADTASESPIRATEPHTCQRAKSGEVGIYGMDDLEPLE